MLIDWDCHLHSSFSGDSQSLMTDMIKRGISLGLEGMCFTEHQDIEYVYQTDTAQKLFDLDTQAYRKELLACREKYDGKLKLGFGVELGVQPHLGNKLKAYVQEYPFDFVIASSHICNRKDPYYPPFYEGRSTQEAYTEYFSSILDNLEEFSNFDVYGHLDYVVRYGPNKDTHYKFSDYQEVLNAVLQKILSLGKGIEINTGGISYGLKELNPCTAIIKRYKELGGEIITFGSDAHSPDHILQGSSRAAYILKECGFAYYTVFKERKPQFIKI